jgi:RNA 2',3'-cyclic 3'-phosphodiesterase
VRLFIAATIPVPVRIDKSIFPSASWVRPESQHLTFAFLGEQDSSVVERIAIDPGPAFDATLRGCGFFPNRKQPRVGWIGVEPAARFIDVASRVRAGLRGIEFDAKPFKPHLTLMRIRDRWPAAVIEAFEKMYGDYRSEPFRIDGVTLFSSELNPKGAIHTAVRTFQASTD